MKKLLDKLQEVFNYLGDLRRGVLVLCPEECDMGKRRGPTGEYLSTCEKCRGTGYIPSRFPL